MIHLDILALADARRHLELGHSLAQQIRSSHWTSCASAWLTSTLLLLGEAQSAEAVLGERSVPSEAPQSIGERLVWCSRAELALARGDVGLALDTLDALIASIPHAAESAGVPRVLRLRGAVLEAMGRLREAEHALEAARAAAIARKTPAELWRAELALGHYYRASGRDEQALAAFNAVREIVDDLSGRVPDFDLRSNFVQRALSSLPPAAGAVPSRATRPGPGSLTAREREVAGLLARGLTNRQIGATLVISEATATVHVKHILGKLGLQSRTQVAAWAVRQGL